MGTAAKLAPLRTPGAKAEVCRLHVYSEGGG